MKKIALSVTGISLFVAGYYHVHHHAAYVATKNAPAGLETPVTQTTELPQKTPALFAFLSIRPFLNNKF